MAVGCAFARTHWGPGYAAEAVGALLAWTLRQSAVRYILAETDVTNLRAHRLLQTLGFRPGERGLAGPTPHGATGDPLVWRLARPAGQ
ncbi:MAG: GNAT family N-acetyltransferase [Candidatus Rokuibacteriota bacterium]